MPKPKKDKPKIVLFPPQITVGKLSNRYTLVIDVKWGDYEKHLEFTKESPGVWERAIEGISEALLEASETTQPYL